MVWCDRERSEEDKDLLELFLTLFKNLLAIPDPLKTNITVSCHLACSPVCHALARSFRRKVIFNFTCMTAQFWFFTRYFFLFLIFQHAYAHTRSHILSQEHIFETVISLSHHIEEAHDLSLSLLILETMYQAFRQDLVCAAALRCVRSVFTSIMLCAE